eukprot:6186499-Pleurochrysis_carterae.AAC.2
MEPHIPGCTMICCGARSATYLVELEHGHIVWLRAKGVLHLVGEQPHRREGADDQRAARRSVVLTGYGRAVLRGCVGGCVGGCVVAWVRGCVVAWWRGSVVAYLCACVGGCVGAWVGAYVRARRARRALRAQEELPRTPKDDGDGDRVGEGRDGERR